MKTLRRMQPGKSAQIRSAITDFAADSQGKYNNVRPLSGIKGGFRIRIGDWRVSVVIDSDAGELNVFEIATRGDAYKW